MASRIASGTKRTTIPFTGSTPTFQANDDRFHYGAPAGATPLPWNTGRTRYEAIGPGLRAGIISKYEASTEKTKFIHDILDELEQLSGQEPGAAAKVVEAVRLIRSELAGRQEEKKLVAEEFARFVQDAATMIRNVQALPEYRTADVLGRQNMLRNAIRTLITRLNNALAAADAAANAPAVMPAEKVIDGGVAAAVTIAQDAFAAAGGPAAPAAGGPGPAPGPHVAPPAPAFADLLTALTNMADELHTAANDATEDAARASLNEATDAYAEAVTAAGLAALPITNHLMNLATIAISLGRRAPAIATARAGGAALAGGPLAAFNVLTATANRLRTAAGADGPALVAARTFADPLTNAAGQTAATNTVQAQAAEAETAIVAAIADPDFAGVNTVALTGPGAAPADPRVPLAGGPFRGGRRNRKTHRKDRKDRKSRKDRKANRKNRKTNRKANRKTGRRN